MTELRAYRQPPWRAEEWFHYFTDKDGGGGLRPINYSGRRNFPEGYRGVMTRAELVIARYRDFGADGTRTDIPLAFAYDVRKNGVVVPGFRGRIPTWHVANWENNASTSTQTATDGWFTSGATEGFCVKFPMLVPLQLKAGDVLDWIITGQQGPSASWAFMAQGYMWPAKDEDERAEGSGADRVGWQ